MIRKGIAAAEGICAGTVKVFDPRPKEKALPSGNNIQEENRRFLKALETYCLDTEKLAKEIEQAGTGKRGEVLRGHIRMAMDPFTLQQITDEIGRGHSAEAAAERIMNSVIRMYQGAGDRTSLKKAADMADIRNSLLRLLQGEGEIDLSWVTRDTVLILEDLLPSVVARLRDNPPGGIVTAGGGYASHGAILARTLGVPVVLGVQGILEDARDGDPVILDGNEGIVLTDPSGDDQDKYKGKAEAFRKRQSQLAQFRDKLTRTADGQRKMILANVSDLTEAETAKANGAEGIGLLRTEFLFLNRLTAPGEDEQFEAYRSIVKIFEGRPVFIRTLDAGGDKEMPYLQSIPGCRGIRRSLMEPEILRTQLKAILRAGAFGNVRMIIPMVTTVTEVREVKKLRDQCIAELTQEGKEFDPAVGLGVMMETPAAVMIADLLAEEADFFSIGTNDLTAYTMCADRGDLRDAETYSVYDPAVLRSISRICLCARQAQIPVEICGEAAADPGLIPVLLALGPVGFSVSCGKIAATRYEFSLWNKEEARSVADRILAGTQEDENKSYLKDKTKGGSQDEYQISY